MLSDERAGDLRAEGKKTHPRLQRGRETEEVAVFFGLHTCLDSF